MTTPDDSAEIIREVLSSKRRDEARSLVVLNAAAALVVGGLAKDTMHAARLAEQSIDSGMAQNKLDRLIQVTNKSVKLECNLQRIKQDNRIYRMVLTGMEGIRENENR